MCDGIENACVFMLKSCDCAGIENACVHVKIM
jgi:hypothetical protein